MAINQERPQDFSQDLTSNTPVPELLFHDGHFDGNKRFPQKMRVIRIYTAAQVLMHPPHDFQELRSSVLSRNQVKKASTEMNAVHQANNIRKFTADFKNLESLRVSPSEIVNPERFQYLWQSDIDGVLRMILQKTHGARPLPGYEEVNFGKPSMISQEETEKLNRFFHHPANRYMVSEMKDAASVVSDFLHDRHFDPFVIQLSELWKSALRPKKDRHIDRTKFYKSDSATRFVLRKYAGAGNISREDTVIKGIRGYEAFAKFFDEIETIYDSPTDTSADKDLIFNFMKDAISYELERHNHAMPFGLDYEDGVVRLPRSERQAQYPQRQ